MTTTPYKFSPSVNIIRDFDVELNYIPTPNTTLVFAQLIEGALLGTRSFNIVGTYGTGKSSFLWALERNLNRKKKYFAKLNGQFKQIKSFQFLNIVGDYDSVVKTFARLLDIDVNAEYKTQDIIRKLDNKYKSLNKCNKGLVIIIDEFGKFLEYAAKNNPEYELYFIQQLAEYVNDLDKNILFITTLHQDFNAYALDLSKSQRHEWDKVKGRLKEITFNEPVEQLLFLASERLSISNNKISKDKSFSNLFTCIKTANVFPLKDYFSKEYAGKLLPFDILSASILTLALQKYGQNERSLFTFIESNDHLGLKDYNKQNNPYYNISCVYDYLIHNYYSFLSTKYNPHYVQWAAIRTAMERVEGVLNSNIDDALKLIKTIGLLNIFATASAKIDFKFLCKYGKYSLGIRTPEKIIPELESFKILRFVKHRSKFILFEGTDLDIELAINEAENLVEKDSNVVNYLNKYFEFSFIPAKAVYYEKGTPRFFAFKLSEEPIDIIPKGEVDGFVNLVFSERLKEKDVKAASAKCDEAILFGLYKNISEINDHIFEIEKIKKVREKHHEDKVATKELGIILDHQIKLLNHYVTGSLYSADSQISWYFGGKKFSITDRKTFNRVLSNICNKIYHATPVFKSELVNKTKLSSPINTAKRNLMRALVKDWNKKDLGLPDYKFPPEKSIYLSLLKETNIHIKTKNGYTLNKPKNESFKALWDEGTEFLETSKTSKRNLSDFVNILLSKPFKLKKGFIDFWLPIFLFIKHDDYALFSKSGYIPYMNDEVLDLIVKNPKEFEIKVFNIKGVRLDLFNKYRNLLNQSQKQTLSNQSFIETIRPFLTFYKGLPEYAKKTKRLSNKTIALRDVIAQSKDPEATFFEDFPKALKYNVTKLQNNPGNLEEFITQLQNSIREIRTCYDELINRVEQFLLDEFIGENMDFPAYKTQLQIRLKDIKKHLLLPNQKVFFQRLLSQLDDRKAWLNSITQACIGKALDVINDEEEKLLYEKLKETIHELDNLCEISKEDVDNEKEDIFKLEITSFIDGLYKKLIRLPKKKTKQMLKIENDIKAKLSEDKQLNIATLTKLLREQLKSE